MLFVAKAEDWGRERGRALPCRCPAGAPPHLALLHAEPADAQHADVRVAQPVQLSQLQDLCGWCGGSGWWVVGRGGRGDQVSAWGAMEEAQGRVQAGIRPGSLRGANAYACSPPAAVPPCPPAAPQLPTSWMKSSRVCLSTVEGRRSVAEKASASPTVA